MYAPLLKSTEQYQFQIVEQAQQSEYQAKIGKDLFAILHITDDLNVNPNAISLLSEKESPQDLRAIIEKTLSEKVMQQKLDELSQSGNVSAESILQVRSIVESGSKVSIKIMKWDEDGTVSESSAEIASIIGVVFTILIYMFILMYGNMVMQAVLEEKKSRIVEVMVSSVKPVKLLIGKIIGIGLVGITQLAIWGVLWDFYLPGFGIYRRSRRNNGMPASAEMGDFDMQAALNSVMSVNWIEILVYFLLFLSVDIFCTHLSSPCLLRLLIVKKTRRSL